MWLKLEPVEKFQDDVPCNSPLLGTAILWNSSFMSGDDSRVIFELQNNESLKLLSENGWIDAKTKPLHHNLNVDGVKG